MLEGAPANAPQAIRDAVQTAKQEMAGVETHRARLTLTVKGPSQPATTLDGVSIPPAALGAQRLVNPGAPGAGGAAENAGNGANGAGALAPGAPPADQVAVDTRGGVPRKTLGWIGVGVGGAGLVTGIVTGVLAMGSRSSAAGSPCANGPCASSDLTSYQSDRDSFHTMATISTIAFVAGGVLAAGGAVLLLTAPKDDHPPASAWARPYLSATGGGVVGAF